MIVRAEHAQIRDYQTMINTVINMLSLHSNQWYKSLLSSENIHLQICQIVTLNEIICFSFRFWRWIISRIQSIFKKKMLFNMLHRVRNAPHPHLRVSSGRRSWRPVPPWTLRLWAALPAGQAGPPGSLCSHRRHGCSPISSPSSSLSPCVRKEASFRCCWGHFVVAGRRKRATFNDEPSCDVCCFVEVWVLD